MKTPSQVAVIRCETYQKESVQKAVEKGLELLGGAQRFAQPGEKILIKPNLLIGEPSEKQISPHPTVFEAVLRCFQESGAALCYGDSPAFGKPGAAARKPGLAEVAERLGVPLADFENGETVSFPEGHLIKQFTIARGVLEADGLISLAKFKTHALTRVTGAIKNQFGCIPGALKAEFHARMSNVELFSQMLVDLNLLLKPRLYIMDGIMAMQGNGPRNGEPYPMRVLLFSTDPAALDATVSRMMNLDPDLVPPLKWAQKWGLGDIEEIEILGDPVEDFIAPGFDANRSPLSTTAAPGRMEWLMKRWVIPRPVIDEEACTRCGSCVKICPAEPKALDFFQGNHGSPPSYQYDRCIRCYCCQETCPHDAITVAVPLLGRLLHRG